jgi:hypothetical protein
MPKQVCYRRRTLHHQATSLCKLQKEEKEGQHEHEGSAGLEKPPQEDTVLHLPLCPPYPMDSQRK